MLIKKISTKAFKTHQQNPIPPNLFTQKHNVKTAIHKKTDLSHVTHIFNLFLKKIKLSHKKTK